MVMMGEGNPAAALKEFQAALDEARRVDPGGPREAEVLSTLALFHEQEGRHEEAGLRRREAEAIFSKFE